MVRAVSPGTFHHPAASVEDMYRPDFRARSDAGTVTIAAVMRARAGSLRLAAGLWLAALGA